MTSAPVDVLVLRCALCGFHVGRLRMVAADSLECGCSDFTPLHVLHLARIAEHRVCRTHGTRARPSSLPLTPLGDCVELARNAAVLTGLQAWLDDATRTTVTVRLQPPDGPAAIA